MIKVERPTGYIDAVNQAHGYSVDERGFLVVFDLTNHEVGQYAPGAWVAVSTKGEDES